MRSKEAYFTSANSQLNVSKYNLIYVVMAKAIVI